MDCKIDFDIFIWLILSIFDLHCSLHTIGNYCVKYEHPLWAVRQLLVYVTLTYDSKLILVIWIFCSDLHIIGNRFAKHEHPRSKNEGGVWVTSKTKWQMDTQTDWWMEGWWTNIWMGPISIYIIINQVHEPKLSKSYSLTLGSILYIIKSHSSSLPKHI